LIEAALFGHERGAFTGAIKSTAGIFEQASEGTVFLDEVGELSAPAQAALLRVLENGQLTRIGSDREIYVDTRVIAATNRDLEQMADEGGFRRDLLYRLNTVTLELLPLRERPEEIRLLAGVFLQLAAVRWQCSVRSLSAEVERLLAGYHWPGNVRELRNVLERAALLCDGPVLEARHLPPAIVGRKASNGAATEEPLDEEGPKLGLREALRRHEVELIQRALESTGGNQRRAAELLEIPRRTLVRKLRGRTPPARHGI
jgi:DNA-binding NtrC family response regulator